MPLDPLPYHDEVARRLEADEPELWAWFRSEPFAASYAEKTGADLLRAGLRLDRSGPNERRYALAECARDALGIAAPVTLYQMHDTTGQPNAYLVFVPGEIVIAFEGRILELLDTDAALLDLFGHEISHHKLFTIEDGRFHSANRLLGWLLQREGCPPEMFETWRRYQLYTEIYCDMGGLIACGDRDATIGSLVRVIADFKDADAAAYLEQARELVAKGIDGSRGTTHPELHARVLAVAHAPTMEPPALHAMIDGLIAGKLDLGRLDLVDQARLRDLTRRIVDRILSDTGARSESAVAHARLMFGAYEPPGAAAAPTLAPIADGLAPSSVDYLAYVLLDFATVDDGGSNGPLAIAATVADEIGIGARFREIARQELKGRRAILSGLVQRAA